MSRKDAKSKQKATKPKYLELDWSVLDEIPAENPNLCDEADTLSEMATRDGSGSESGSNGDEGKRSDVLLHPPRVKRQKNPLPEAVEHAIQRNSQAAMETRLTPFGPRVFKNAYEFVEAWRAYEARLHLKYRTRHSKTAAADNAERLKNRKEKGLPVDAKFLSSMVPEEVGYKMISKRCTHGCYQ